MITRILIIYCILSGAVQSWAYRHAMNADGVPYLDIGDAWMRLDWKSIVNSYWSPVYPLLLGIANLVGGQNPRNDFVRAHAVNFALFLATLAAFTWFLRRFIQNVDAKGLYRASLLAGGYSLFLYSALELQANRNVTPDMGLMAVIYIAGGQLLDWGNRNPTRSAVWLGVALGIGFWIKGAAFAAGWIFIVAAAISGGRSRAHLRAAAVAVAAFLAMCLPWIAAMSWQTGRLNTGDTGRLNYAFLVNGVYMTHWRGDPSLATQPIHPTRIIAAQPDTFEFATPIAGTYPPWDNPAYWNEGINPHFHLDKQIAVLEDSAAFLRGLFFRPLIAWTLMVVLVGALAFRAWFAYWWIVLACLAVVGMYALVLIEGRYVAPFIALLVFVLTAGAPSKVLNFARLGAGVLTLGLVGVSQFNIARQPYPAASEQVAQSLEELGLRPGEKVAVVEDGLRHYWARLARVRVVAEIPSAEQYSQAPVERRLAALSAVDRTGARWLVSSKPLPGSGDYSWHPVPSTNYFYMHRPQSGDSRPRLLALNLAE
ncbi:MAG: hypothetical protein JO307_10685 [Bryobacterales bacterium]|nr:hypothetical protein [Bryobacterales bacterium]MBV9397672.1 hypothetical protein [Bryobacterales bacterium]